MNVDGIKFAQPVFRMRRKARTGTAGSYWIPKHVYVCATDNGGVILDLRNDRYAGVPRGQMRVLHTLVEDWPLLELSTVPDRDPVSAADATALAATLIDEGLLTRDPKASRSIPSAEIMMDASAAEPYTGDEPASPIRIGHVLSFVASVAVAFWMLRIRSLQFAAEQIARRKQQAVNVDFDARKAMQLAHVFNRLRSLLYTGKDRCLFDTLALLNFLYRYRLFPTWVIGVATGPFKAHSWVQHGSIVLGSTPQDTYFAYTPIMVV